MPEKKKPRIDGVISDFKLENTPQSHEAIHHADDYEQHKSKK
jgi:hypothetical protein